jgi:ferredoxin-NADP reductase
MTYCAYAMSVALEFVRRQREADDVISFFFCSQQPLAFEAGEFLELSLPHAAPDSRGSQRCLTIASAPSEPLVQLTTRVGPTPSTFKQALCDLRQGDVVAATGPMGDFVYDQDGAPVVLIAGGIGITPFRSMLLDLASRPARPDVSLLYSNASAEIPFRAEFDALRAGWPELRLVYTVTRPGVGWRGATGRIGADFIAHYVPDLAQSRFFVCGPAAFTEAVVDALEHLGVSAAQINQEEFPGYEPVSRARLAAAV